jgi:hypothetical protein
MILTLLVPLTIFFKSRQPGTQYLVFMPPFLQFSLPFVVSGDIKQLTVLCEITYSCRSECAALITVLDVIMQW